MDRDGAVEEYNHLGGTYTPDPMNEYYLVGGVTQAHDANGNLTNDGVFTYQYNYANQLVKVTRISDGAVVGEYKYAADARRLERIAGSTTHRYHWWGWQLAETRDGLDVQVESHVWGDWIDELLSSDLGVAQVRYYFLENAIGSVCQATNAAGLVVEETKYPDIYGQVAFFACVDLGATRTSTPVGGTQIGNRHLFQGREWDGEAGLYQFRNRAHAVATGRFLQRDPLQDVWLRHLVTVLSSCGFEVGSTRDEIQNQYSYGDNAPTCKRDPLGLKAISVSNELRRKGRGHTSDVPWPGDTFTTDHEGPTPAPPGLPAPGISCWWQCVTQCTAYFTVSEVVDEYCDSVENRKTTVSGTFKARGWAACTTTCTMYCMRPSWLVGTGVSADSTVVLPTYYVVEMFEGQFQESNRR